MHGFHVLPPPTCLGSVRMFSVAGLAVITDSISTLLAGPLD